MSPLNATQLHLLRAFIQGEKVDTVYAGSISSGWSYPCHVCGKSTMYPTYIGVGPEVQVFFEPTTFVSICKSCEDNLKAEHFRRTTYDKLFTMDCQHHD